MSQEVINLDDSSEGGVGSLVPRAEQPRITASQTFSEMVTHTQPSPLGQASRGPGPAVRLDHLSITYPGVSSNWHVNRQAKDLGTVYPYDAELMLKVGEVCYLEASCVMMARCMAIMEYHCRASEERVSLHGRLIDLEQKVDHLTKEKEKVEQEVLNLKKAKADKDSMLAEKEVQLVKL